MKRFLGPGLLAVVLAGGVGYWFLSPASLIADVERFAPYRNRLESGESLKIVAIGDSITAGTNSPRPYSAILEEQLNARFPRARVRVVNAGVPGDTAEGGLRRVDRDVLSQSPDLVLIEFGWNDLKNGVSAEDFETSMRSLVGQIRSDSEAMIYLLTTTHVNVVLSSWKISSRNKIIRAIAKDLDCGLIDLDRAFGYETGSGVDLKDLLSNDNLHPSDLGQSLIARTVLQNWLGGRN
ncbi:MAG: SGNH/GDSL hydrolase family protein [Candidatus Omnitrophica bacterium]|nr:SGNH/GDSL hydrolase family protein [Candidatus Omnitrophota bacterium]